MPADRLAGGAPRGLEPAQRAALADLYEQPAVRSLGSAARRRGALLWVVGGPVRDALLGKLSCDIDLVTDLPREQVRDLLLDAGGFGQEAGAKLGTVSGKVPSSGGVRTSVDISPLRAPSPAAVRAGSGRWDALTWDLAQRDLTVNAIAMDTVSGQLHDPLAGAGDVAAGVLRTPLAAEVTFSMDAVRMVRALRFAAVFGWDLTPQLESDLREHADLLTPSLAFRIFSELDKVDQHGPGAVLRVLRLARDLGLLGRLVPDDFASRLEHLGADDIAGLDDVIGVLSSGLVRRRDVLRAYSVPRGRAHRLQLAHP